MSVTNGKIFSWRDSILRLILLSVFLWCIAFAQAETYYVNNLKGSDRCNGKTEKEAVASLAKGVSLLKAGDRLVIMNTGTDYHESLVLHDLAGTKEKPIEIDGCGSILDGAVSIPPESWTSRGNDLYSMPLKMPDFIKIRFFLLFNGKINRMGNILKAYQPFSFKVPDQLLPNEWTFREMENKLYVRLPKGTTLEQAKLARPDFSRWESGVRMFGTCRHIIIRNLTTTHFYNDGYNIHGDCTEIEFYNVRALYNGDDGISAHEACSFLLDGFYSEGCGTGICHIQSAKGIHKNAVLKNAAGIEIALFNDTENVLENITVESTAILGVIVEGKSCVIKNVKINYIGSGKKTRIRTKDPVIGTFEIINGKD